MPEIISNSHDDTFNTGIKIASLLINAGGFVIALKGALGSGKTCLVKGIAQGLGIKENITSPTYTIVNEYPIPMGGMLYHIDAYRLDSIKDFEDIGGVEILNSNNICIIEWSERIANCIPADAVTITFEITGEQSRLIKIEGLGKINLE